MLCSKYLTSAISMLWQAFEKLCSHLLQIYPFVFAHLPHFSLFWNHERDKAQKKRTNNNF